MSRSIDLRKIICFDTETTGVTPNDEVLQLSIVDGEYNVLMDEYFRPSKHQVWPEAERVHHISPEMVAEKEKLAYFYPKIMEILNSAQVYVGYNVLFDIKMLKYENIDMAPFHRPGTQVIDVMRNFAPIFGDYNEQRRQYRWKKLSVCADYYKYDWKHTTAHNSLADTMATMYCFKKMNNLE